MSAKKFKPLPRHIREPVSLALGGVIRDERQLRGWSLSELAARSGLTRQMLTFIESHERLPSVETTGRIGRAMGLLGSTLLARAEQRAAAWPPDCQHCNYSCVADGELKWWNPARGCIRTVY